MNVRHIIDEKGGGVVTCAPQTSLREAAVSLAEHRIGAVVVAGRRGIEGILSERDIVAAVASEGAGALDKAVTAFMTRHVVTCRLNHSTDELMEMMTNERFRHLPVEEDGRLIGIISIGDVVKRRIAEVQREADSIRQYVTS